MDEFKHHYIDTLACPACGTDSTVGCIADLLYRAEHPREARTTSPQTYAKEVQQTQMSDLLSVKDLLTLSISDGLRTQLKRALLAGRIKMTDSVQSDRGRHWIRGRVFLDA